MKKTRSEHGSVEVAEQKLVAAPQGMEMIVDNPPKPRTRSPIRAATSALAEAQGKLDKALAAKDRADRAQVDAEVALSAATKARDAAQRQVDVLTGRAES